MNHTHSSHFESVVLSATGATDMRVAEVLQELWSGYGQILRLILDGCGTPTVVVKHVRMPIGPAHPRGWNSDLSHDRGGGTFMNRDGILYASDKSLAKAVREIHLTC